MSAIQATISPYPLPPGQPSAADRADSIGRGLCINKATTDDVAAWLKNGGAPIVNQFCDDVGLGRVTKDDQNERIKIAQVVFISAKYPETAKQVKNLLADYYDQAHMVAQPLTPSVANKAKQDLNAVRMSMNKLINDHIVKADASGQLIPTCTMNKSPLSI